MDTKRNRAASSSGAAAQNSASRVSKNQRASKSRAAANRSNAARTKADATLDESARRALETESRVLGAFPWARFLAPADRARFADELSNHPTEMTNVELEALLVSWRALADAARRRTIGGDNSSRQGGRAA